jgi:magnesium-transporting ATPase (P-type)
MMAVQHEVPGGTRVVLKGAPESLLELCGSFRADASDAPMAGDDRASIQRAADAMAAQALRVLAVAVVDGGAIEGAGGFGAFRGRAVFLGLVGQLDPPRGEVKDAVALCRAAGIRPVMVTGDHKATARAIAEALEIAQPGDEAVDGRELEAMSDEELAARIDRISVFARVHPAQKLRIVGAYQLRGHVVAMTGDGVNDAPALVKADVGVAMGIAGTEVAKEAAEIVIADDNFATIVAAVEEGRVVYRNIKKAILHQFSTSAAEVVVLLLAVILGYPPPFAAVQILWNNLVTEGVITVNLVMDPPAGDEMQARPIPANEPLLTRVLLTRMGVMVPAMVVSTLGWFIVRTAQGTPAAVVQTETFTLLAICEWFNVLNCRSETQSALNLGLLRNRWLLGGLILGNVLQVLVVFWTPLGRIFHTVPISLTDVVALGVVGSLVLWAEELRKLFVRRRARRLADGELSAA